MTEVTEKEKIEEIETETEIEIDQKTETDTKINLRKKVDLVIVQEENKNLRKEEADPCIFDYDKFIQINKHILMILSML